MDSQWQFSSPYQYTSACTTRWWKFCLLYDQRRKRFEGITFPRPLIEAQKRGELAIFAGAGVSMPAPSRLPGFDHLANELANGTAIRQMAARSKSGLCSINSKTYLKVKRGTHSLQ
jgi:hypothetical protein